MMVLWILALPAPERLQGDGEPLGGRVLGGERGGAGGPVARGGGKGGEGPSAGVPYTEDAATKGGGGGGSEGDACVGATPRAVVLVHVAGETRGVVLGGGR